MNEARLRKRAELRRRIAYHQGGSDGVEPNTYKDEKALEGKLRGEDRQMKQDKSMGGDSGMFPGDEQTKQKLSRAKYSGPALRTKFSTKTSAGKLDKRGSVFEVFSGKNRVITATAGEIFGSELSDNWNWLSSQEYGQEVCKQIRAHGLDYVSGLLKAAQPVPGGDMGAPPMDLPPLPGEDIAAAPAGDMAAPPPPVDDMGDMESGGGDADDLDGAGEDPKEAIENALVEMEERVDEVRDLVGQLGGGQDVDIDIAVSPEGADLEDADDGGGMPALASELVQNLKTAMAELNESADELALIAETFEGEKQLTAAQRSDLRKIAFDALDDSYDLNMETKALVRVTAGLVKNAQVNDASDGASVMYLEDESHMDHEHKNDMQMYADDQKEEDHMADGELGHEAGLSDQSLMAEAMNLRRERREAILKQAENSELKERKLKRESLLKESQQHQAAMAEVDGVANDLAEKAENDARSLDEHLDNSVKDPEEDDLEMPADDGPTVALAGSLKGKLQSALEDKRAEEDRESYKLQLRRAYDVAMDMQRKGLISQTKPALDKQVDEIMHFDSNAFEAFKRTIANTRPVSSVKTASDLGGVNIGVESSESSSSVRNTVDVLTSMWE